MSLQTNLQNLATRVATECKALRTLVNANQTDLSSLSTVNKTSLVAAVNELQTALAALQGNSAGINDGTTGGTTTWSSTKVAAEIAAAKDALVGGAGTALDTLQELAAALGNNANFSTAMATSLGKRVSVEGAQAFSTGEKLQACQNIGIGDPETNFVTTFNAGLV